MGVTMSSASAPTDIQSSHSATTFKRKLFVAFVVVLALAVGVATGKFLRMKFFRSALITINSYEQIQPGMTRAYVTAFLGPPGDYRTGPTVSDSLVQSEESRDTDLPDRLHGAFWEGDHGIIWIGFDDSGHVARKVFFRSTSLKESFFSEMMDGLERWWKQVAR
jgi:hypothetical protein